VISLQESRKKCRKLESSRRQGLEEKKKGLKRNYNKAIDIRRNKTKHLFF
jgi:hypothetical protein